MKSISIKRFGYGMTPVALAFALAMGATPAAATDYPAKPIKIVVPFTAGGTTDIIARMLGQSLGSKLKQPVIIENKPGAGSMLGTAEVARSDPDGYTLLMAGSSSLVIAPVINNAGYDPVKDFVPVSLVASSPLAVFVNPALPVKSISELISYAKKNPEELSFASYGAGSLAHLAGEMFNGKAGTSMLHIPYKGSAPAMTDVIGGQVQVGFDMVTAVLPHYQAKRIRVLAVTGAEPSDEMPDVPPITADLPQYEASAWFGVVAPAGTPESIVNTLSTTIQEAVQTDEIQAVLKKNALTPRKTSSQEFSVILQDDLKKWTEIISEADIKP